MAASTALARAAAAVAAAAFASTGLVALARAGRFLVVRQRHRLRGRLRRQGQHHLVYLFGLPGAGKNFVGQLLEERFGYRFLDADRWLPEGMVRGLQQGRAFTPAERDHYYGTVIAGRIDALLEEAESQGATLRVAVGQATFKARHRTMIQSRRPHAVELWHVTASEPVRRARVRLRDAETDGTSAGDAKDAPAAAGHAVLSDGSRAADSEWDARHLKSFEPPEARNERFRTVDNSSGAAAVCAQIDTLLRTTDAELLL